jgi:hypothetical protein
MQHNAHDDFSDTVQVGATEATSDGAPADAGAAADVDLWPEAADFQCSEHASMFASSQAAPLNVV